MKIFTFHLHIIESLGKRFVVALLLVLSSYAVHAYDFEFDGIYYNITSTTKLKVEVTSKISGGYRAPYRDVTIPSTFEYRGRKFSVTSIGAYAFGQCSSLTSVNIPNSVMSIKKGAFSQCTNLISIHIPDNVGYIEESAFYGCKSLTSVKLSNCMTSIGNGAFLECTSLKSINIPNSVTSIGLSAFSKCSSLTSVNIPNSVTYIGQDAFGGCISLKDIYCFSSTPVELDSNTFDTKIYLFATVHVPKGCVEVYKASKYWSKFYEIVEFDASSM